MAVLETALTGQEISVDYRNWTSRRRYRDGILFALKLECVRAALSTEGYISIVESVGANVMYMGPCTSYSQRRSWILLRSTKISRARQSQWRGRW